VEGEDGSEDVSLPDIHWKRWLNTTYDLIFAHPDLVVDSKNVVKLLKTPAFKRKVRAIVVDEAHLVIDWKDFRPAYSTATATATKAMQKKSEDSLGMFNATEILVSPDCSNIYLSLSR